MAKTINGRTFYSYGTAPVELIREALEQQCPKGYKMELTGKDRELVTKLVNQGIDSHLEALTSSNFNNRVVPIKGSVVRRSFLDCRIPADDMLVLLRRLSDDGSEQAMLMRIDILGTLDIEEV